MKTICIFILMFFFSRNYIKAQSDSIVFDDLLEMSFEELMQIKVYSVSKQAETISEAPMSVYIMDKEELKSSGTRYLFETLARTPSFTFYNADFYGTDGIAARGLKSIWRYQYSIDLMPIIDFGDHTFPSHFFKSVETARGAASFAWGSSATAGIINSNVRDDLNGIEFLSSFGNFNYRNYSIMSGYKFNKTDFIFVGVDIEQQDYEEQENAYNIPSHSYLMNGLNPSSSLLAKFKYKFIDFTFFQELADHVTPQLFFDKPYRYNKLSNNWEQTQIGSLWDSIPYYTNKLPHDELTTTAARLVLNAPKYFKFIDFSTYLNYYRKTWMLQPIGQDGSEVVSLGWSLSSKLLGEKLSLNSGGDFVNINRKDIGSVIFPYGEKMGLDWFDGIYHSSKEISNSAYLQASYRLGGKLTFLAGIRADRKLGAGYEFLFTPRFGLFYAPNQKVLLKYLYNNAPRRARANELLENNKLKPEVVYSHEFIGMFSFWRRVNGSITLFSQKLKDQIERKAGSFNKYENHAGIETLGAEWNLTYNLFDFLKFYYNGSYFNIKDLSSLNSAKNQNYIPRYNSIVRSSVNIGNQLKLNLTWRAIYNIAYTDINRKNKEINIDFFDLTLVSKKYWDIMELSINALNILNNKKEVPAWGEHAGVYRGTIEPEGLRFYFKSVFYFDYKKNNK